MMTFWNNVEREARELEEKIGKIVDRRIDALLPVVNDIVVAEVTRQTPTPDPHPEKNVDLREYVSKREFNAFVEYVRECLNPLIAKRLSQAEIDLLKIKLTETRGEKYKETLKKYQELKDIK